MAEQVKKRVEERWHNDAVPAAVGALSRLLLLLLPPSLSPPPSCYPSLLPSRMLCRTTFLFLPSSSSSAVPG
eukprot:3306538-Rhodomonas_salina.2